MDGVVRAERGLVYGVLVRAVRVLFGDGCLGFLRGVACSGVRGVHCNIPGGRNWVPELRVWCIGYDAHCMST
jgi:hypothetical protein